VRTGLRGAFSASVFAGVGQGLEALKDTEGLGRGGFFAASVAAHGAAGCLTAEVGGGDCGSGLVSASFSKAITFLPGMQALSNEARTRRATRPAAPVR
jgi:hypothetical protein